MLKDKHIRLIQDFPQATGENAVFNANIPGGVSYFLWDKDYTGLCEFNGIQRNIGEFDVLVRDNTSHQILKKVIKHKAFCDGRVLSRKPFGLPTNFSEWVSEDTEGAIKCYTNRREIRFVTENQTSGNPCLKWVVFGAKATGHNGEVFAKESDNVGYRNVFLGEAGAICTETYLVLGSFGTKKEAENYFAYTQTKFFQFMLSLRVITQDVNTKRFAWVPDFGSYANPVTDEDLYAHFNLTKKEIEHIESTIKEI
jgi:site-specific DNA-methyltransferase (adenine-specific)